MAVLAAQSIDAAGSALAFSSAAGGGDSTKAGDNRILIVRNADASSKTVTLTTPGTVEGLAIADRAVVVPASEFRMIRLESDQYADSEGNVAIAYSAVTSVTVAVITV